MGCSPRVRSVPPLTTRPRPVKWVAHLGFAPSLRSPLGRAQSNGLLTSGSLRPSAHHSAAPSQMGCSPRVRSVPPLTTRPRPVKWVAHLGFAPSLRSPLGRAQSNGLLTSGSLRPSAHHSAAPSQMGCSPRVRSVPPLTTRPRPVKWVAHLGFAPSLRSPLGRARRWGRPLSLRVLNCLPDSFWGGWHVDVADAEV